MKPVSVGATTAHVDVDEHGKVTAVHVFGLSRADFDRVRAPGERHYPPHMTLKSSWAKRVREAKPRIVIWTDEPPPPAKPEATEAPGVA